MNVDFIGNIIGYPLPQSLPTRHAHAMRSEADIRVFATSLQVDPIRPVLLEMLRDAEARDYDWVIFSEVTAPPQSCLDEDSSVPDIALMRRVGATTGTGTVDHPVILVEFKAPLLVYGARHSALNRRDASPDWIAMTTIAAVAKRVGYEGTAASTSITTLVVGGHPLHANGKGSSSSSDPSSATTNTGLTIRESSSPSPPGIPSAAMTPMISSAQNTQPSAPFLIVLSSPPLPVVAAVRTPTTTCTHSTPEQRPASSAMPFSTDAQISKCPHVTSSSPTGSFSTRNTLQSSYPPTPSTLSLDTTATPTMAQSYT